MLKFGHQKEYGKINQTQDLSSDSKRVEDLPASPVNGINPLSST